MIGDVTRAKFRLVGIEPDVEPINRNRSRCRGEQSGHHLYSGGLSRTVRTEESEELACLDFEREPVHRCKIAEFLRHLVQSYHGIPKMLVLCANKNTESSNNPSK